jgi:hypothetical protein
MKINDLVEWFENLFKIGKEKSYQFGYDRGLNKNQANMMYRLKNTSFDNFIALKYYISNELKANNISKVNKKYFKGLNMLSFDKDNNKIYILAEKSVSKVKIKNIVIK